MPSSICIMTIPQCYRRLMHRYTRVLRRADIYFLGRGTTLFRWWLKYPIWWSWWLSCGMVEGFDVAARPIIKPGASIRRQHRSCHRPRLDFARPEIRFVDVALSDHLMLKWSVGNVRVLRPADVITISPSALFERELISCRSAVCQQDAWPDSFDDMSVMFNSENCELIHRLKIVR